MRPDQALVVCLPWPPEATESGEARLYADTGPLPWLDAPAEAAETEKSDLKVVHPKNNLPTVGFRVRGDRVVFAGPRHANALEDSATLLWFPPPDPPATPPEVLTLTRREEKSERRRTRHFQRVAVSGTGRSSLADGLARSAAGPDGPLGECLYERVSMPREGASRRRFWVVATGASEADRPDEPRGWVNPVVLRVSLDGESLGALVGAEPGSGIVDDQDGWWGLAGRRETLHALLGRADNLLAVAALFEKPAPIQRRRRYLAGVIGRWRGGPVTAVEGLLAGSGRSRLSTSPDPFVTLDHLGGIFYLAPALSPACSTPLRAWGPPGNLSGNLRWLAERLIEQWGGTLEPAVDPVPAAKVWPGPPKSRWVSLRNLEVEENRFRGLSEASRVLARLAGDGQGLWADLVALFAEDGGDHGDRDHWHRGYLRSTPPGPGHPARMEVDEAGLLGAVARRFLVPRSPVWVPLPSAAELPAGASEDLRLRHRETFEGSYFDLIRTPRHGAGRFLRELHARTREEATEEPTLVYRRGWWSRWLEAVYRRRAEAPWRFELSAGGFVLGTDRLGQAPLGAGSRPTSVPEELRL